MFFSDEWWRAGEWTMSNVNLLCWCQISEKNKQTKTGNSYRSLFIYSNQLVLNNYDYMWFSYFLMNEGEPLGELWVTWIEVLSIVVSSFRKGNKEIKIGNSSRSPFIYENQLALTYYTYNCFCYFFLQNLCTIYLF